MSRRVGDGPGPWVRTYWVVLEHDGELDVWVTHCLDLDAVYQGRVHGDPSEAIRDLRDAVEDTLLGDAADDLSGHITLPRDRGDTTSGEDWTALVGTMLLNRVFRLDEIEGGRVNGWQKFATQITVVVERGAADGALRVCRVPELHSFAFACLR